MFFKMAYLSSEPSTTFRHFTTHLLCDRQYRNFYIALISFSETVGIHSVALKVRTHSRNIEGCEHIPFSTWASWLFSHSPTRFFRNGFNHVSESASLRWPPAEALAYIAGALMYLIAVMAHYLSLFGSYQYWHVVRGEISSYDIRHGVGPTHHYSRFGATLLRVPITPHSGSVRSLREKLVSIGYFGVYGGGNGCERLLLLRD
ncbi:hypothetical protein WG66_000749 [Moniliophthora roreri]|nr:hypothetical protein WG66_000749 [Moniliophthora roreri]